MINEKNFRVIPVLKNFLFNTDPSSNFYDTKRNNILLLTIPIAVSLLIKLILLAALFKTSINNDGTMYVTVAKYYAQGEFAKGLALYPMPAYPLLLLFIHLIIRDWIVAGYIISITSMVLATIPLYYLTKELFSLRAAFWASLIFAVLPKFNEWSLYLSRDPLFLFVFGLCVYNGLKSIKEKNLTYFILTFFFTWTAILIRIEGILFVFFYFFSLLICAGLNREKRIHYISRAAIWAGIPLGIMLTGLLIAGTKGMAFNRFDQVFSEILKLFSGSFLEKYFQIYDFFKKAENSPPFSGWKYNLASLTRHYLFIIYFIGITEILFRVIFPLSAIPLIVGLKKKVSSSGVFLLFLGFSFIMLVYYSLITRDFFTSRFLMMPAFLLLPWVGSGMNHMCENINSKKYKKMVLALIAILVMSPALKSIEIAADNDNSIPRAAKWIVQNYIDKNTIIATNNKQTSFYLNLDTGTIIKWPARFYDTNKESSNFEIFALNNKANIIVYKTRNEKIKDIPDFKFFKLIKTFSSNDFTTNIYDRIID